MFGVGLLITRLTSIVLLPVYTRVLTPADYGVLAFLDSTQELLRLALATSLVAATGRFHFDTESEDRRSQVWWTSLAAMSGFGALAIGAILPLAPFLARHTLGPEVTNGGLLFALMLISLWFALAEGLFLNHLRVIKRSRLSVVLSLMRLFANAALNITLLYHFKWGVASVLWGNLAVGIVWMLIHFAIFAKLRGFASFDWTYLRPMMHFGAPLMAVALLSVGMHQVSRYVLLWFYTPYELGIYSLAYTIGQGITGLVLTPFSQIWSVVVFEIDKLPDSKRTFGLIFGMFGRGLALVLLAASLGSTFAVQILADPAYWPAADLIPIIAFAYFFFALDDHFRVPALLQKRTLALVPVYGFAVVSSLILNLILVPLAGATGAAWASVATFAGFAYVGLQRYRRIDRIDYPLGETAAVIGLVVAAYAGFRLIVADRSSFSGLAIAGAIWLVLSVVLLRKPLHIWRQRAH
jgi:O-antigen/teichoic acid export membrane protein